MKRKDGTPPLRPRDCTATRRTDAESNWVFSGIPCAFLAESSRSIPGLHKFKTGRGHDDDSKRVCRTSKWIVADALKWNQYLQLNLRMPLTLFVEFP